MDPLPLGSGSAPPPTPGGRWLGMVDPDPDSGGARCNGSPVEAGGATGRRLRLAGKEDRWPMEAHARRRVGIGQRRCEVASGGGGRGGPRGGGGWPMGGTIADRVARRARGARDSWPRRAAARDNDGGAAAGRAPTKARRRGRQQRSARCEVRSSGRRRRDEVAHAEDSRVGAGVPTCPRRLDNSGALMCQRWIGKRQTVGENLVRPWSSWQRLRSERHFLLRVLSCYPILSCGATG